MRPGGHLATAVVLSGAGYGVTGSAELAAGFFAGAFMIDVDHYLDYLTVEGQWRRPGPAQFLRYYFAHRYHRLVLPLHSIELMSALVTLAVAWPRLALVGYLTGALLHLLLDVLVKDSRIKACLLSCCECVEIPSERFETLRDLAYAATRCSLEHHMFEEVGDSVLRTRLVA